MKKPAFLISMLTVIFIGLYRISYKSFDNMPIFFQGLLFILVAIFLGSLIVYVKERG